MVQDPNQSSFGLTPNVAAALASFFMGIGGLVILLGKPMQQWVRFVAVQSIVLAIAWIVLNIVLSFIRIFLWAIPGVGFTLSAIVGIIYMLCALAFLVMWVIQTIKAFQGGAQRFPLISDWTDRFMPAAVNLTSTFTPPPSYNAPPPTYTAPPPPAQPYNVAPPPPAPPPPTPPAPPDSTNSF
jgi:uncharacterized membrane protein